ncbi:Histone-lysine N-methyltransferase MLL [Myotis brandtii]|uniref:Histone-lysine N-methyltransferase MLL n=1 Tax=Myotis brandtii TaxID=109478 RepID=S7MDK6_MYOBR|nr:Histone-lysine N-methyltransferase MLL [Myotis brandtii]
MENSAILSLFIGHMGKSGRGSPIAHAANARQGGSEDTGSQWESVGTGSPHTHLVQSWGLRQFTDFTLELLTCEMKSPWQLQGGGGQADAAAACMYDEQFLGFGSDEEVRVRSPTRSPSAKSSPRKPRGRPRSGSDRTPLLPDPPAFPQLSKPETRPGDKIKKKDSKSLEKKRGRPPTFPGVKIKITHGKDIAELPKGSKDDSLKKLKRTPSATFQQATKIKKLRAGKLSPLKSKFKAGKLQIGRKGVQIVRRRGRPPSAERPQKVRRDADAAPALAKEDKAVVRQSPRRVKPVRIIPSSKRTDATIAKQLLQRAKKGAQKKIEKEAAQLQGRKVKTQVKNIRQFIMPVREKENKRESRKEKRKKGSEPPGSSALYPAGRVSKEKVGAEEGAAPSSAKKVTGRKKSSSLDSGPEVAAVTLGDTTAVKTKILIKKGRGSLE